MATIASQQGFWGLYAGLVPTVLRQSSNQGVRFVVFGKSKDYLSQFTNHKMIVDLISGAFAGFCSTLANNPIDVCKTKMQGVHGHGVGFVHTF